MSSFAAKIDMAFALGITSPETHGRLGHFRKMRNHFAHTASITSFEDERLKPLMKLMKGDQEDLNPAQIFSSFVLKIRGALIEYMAKVDEHYRDKER
jgi:hypothetical protein